MTATLTLDEACIRLEATAPLLNEAVERRQKATSTTDAILARARENALLESMLPMMEAAIASRGVGVNFKEGLHPRDRIGQFMEKLSAPARKRLAIFTRSGRKQRPSAVANELASIFGGAAVSSDRLATHFGSVPEAHPDPKPVGAYMSTPTVNTTGGGGRAGSPPVGSSFIGRPDSPVKARYRVGATREVKPTLTQKAITSPPSPAAQASQGGRRGGVNQPSPHHFMGDWSATQHSPEVGLAGGPDSLPFNPKAYDVGAKRHHSRIAPGGHFAANYSAYRKTGPNTAVGVHGRDKGRQIVMSGSYQTLKHVPQRDGNPTEPSGSTPAPDRRVAVATSEPRYKVVLGLGREPKYASTLKQARVIRDLEAGSKIVDTREPRGSGGPGNLAAMHRRDVAKAREGDRRMRANLGLAPLR